MIGISIRRIVADDWKSIKEIWADFNSSAFSRYDKPHNTDDANVQQRIAKWAEANSGTEHMFFAACLGDTEIGYIAFNIRENGHEIGYCFHSAYHGKGYAIDFPCSLFRLCNVYQNHQSLSLLRQDKTILWKILPLLR